MYLDHSATSFPKPQELFDEILAFQADIGGSPGRGGHEAAEKASALVDDTRFRLAQLFHATSPDRIVFTANATEALNLALLGLLEPGNHVVATVLEHNSVLRPLHHLRVAKGVDVTLVPCDARGFVDPSDVKRAVRPSTRLAVVNHASNVTGAVQPIEEIARCLGAIPLLVDATQSAGLLPLDVERTNIALLAFTGHKSLYGPTGVGGLYLREDQRPAPLKTGGTGTFSESPEMPDTLPERYECGTMNVLGIAGLRGGLRFLERVTPEAVLAHERALLDHLTAALDRCPAVRVHGPRKSCNRTGTLSLTAEGWEPSELSFLLDRQYGIRTRSGLHCSPLAHRHLGTFPQGTLRVSVGWFNTVEDMNRLAGAIEELSGMKA